MEGGELGSCRRNVESEVAYRIARYDSIDWDMAPEALMQLNKIRESLGCSLMDAIGYIVRTIRENIENFEVTGTNPRGRIEGLERIPNHETEENRLRREGCYTFPCKVLNSFLSDPIYAILRLESLRERDIYSGRI